MWSGHSCPLGLAHPFPHPNSRRCPSLSRFLRRGGDLDFPSPPRSHLFYLPPNSSYKSLLTAHDTIEVSELKLSFVPCASKPPRRPCRWSWSLKIRRFEHSQLSHCLIKTLPVSPYSSKIWQKSPSKSFVFKDRVGGVGRPRKEASLARTRKFRGRPPPPSPYYSKTWRNLNEHSQLSHCFIKTLRVSPYSSKIWRKSPSKSFVFKDRIGEGEVANEKRLHVKSRQEEHSGSLARAFR